MYAKIQVKRYIMIIIPVSYTHLDVYKRQSQYPPFVNLMVVGLEQMKIR